MGRKTMLRSLREVREVLMQLGYKVADIESQMKSCPTKCANSGTLESFNWISSKLYHSRWSESQPFQDQKSHCVV